MLWSSRTESEICIPHQGERNRKADVEERGAETWAFDVARRQERNGMTLDAEEYANIRVN